ncbi:MAG: methionine--tRNA ligase [Candidatus Pacebacteria bacterium]|nr:methionine--tRNA ligase [Candidatus Paceibacterota bacterium]
MKNSRYLTTTLPYVNADPHLGFALEIVQADCLARFYRFEGVRVFFNTGTDEHGLKIYRKALEAKQDPQEYANEFAAKFDRLKKALNLSYTNFIRTTDPDHKKSAREFWQRCLKNGDIFKAKQKIKYCVGCELEKTDSELRNGYCPYHPNKPIEILKEENYFFRFSRYQEPLLQLYQKNPEFVLPREKFQEIKKFVAGGLKDFSISRLKKKMPWGVNVPGDPEHVMYVWFDALVNYISAIGWPKDPKKFKKWWPVIQFAGKDNLRQQSAMWQAMLLSAGLPPSKQILIHGFITADGQKMSKSLGNVINPFDLVNKYGTDAVRYYLLREIPPFKDGDFSSTRFKQLYQSDLANGLGNLISRVAKLCQNSGIIFGKKETGIPDKSIKAKIKNYRPDLALEKIWKKIDLENKRINDQKPWELSGRKLKDFLLKSASEIVRIGLCLQPFLPETAEKILKQFNNRSKVKIAAPLFPRLN